MLNWRSLSYPSDASMSRSWEKDLTINKTTKNALLPAEYMQMGGEGFEPSKAVPADLQSVPFGHSGIHPCTPISNY